MQPVALSDAIAVGEFPTTEQIAILAKAGFKSLLNSQPEGEVDRLIPAAAMADAARAAGLAYHFLPLETRRPSDAQIQAFSRAIATLPKPIYAFCYSGSRSAAAWALASSAFMDTDAIHAACASAGYDIAFLAPQLAERRTRRPAAVLAAAVVAGVETDDDVPLPTLMPRVILPRASSSGGFAM